MTVLLVSATESLTWFMTLVVIGYDGLFQPAGLI